MFPRIGSVLLRGVKTPKGFVNPIVYNACRGFASAAPSSQDKTSQTPSPATKPSTSDTSSSSQGSIFDIDSPRVRIPPVSVAATPAGMYATAIYSKASSIDEVVRTAHDLDDFIEVLSADQQLASKVTDDDASPAYLNSFFTTYFDNVETTDTAKELFAELASKSKLELVDPITTSLYEMMNAGVGVQQVTVTVADEDAEPPSEEEIVKKLDLPTGSSVNIECYCDESLLGGYILETETKLFDNSYKKDLEEVEAGLEQYYRDEVDRDIAEMDAQLAGASQASQQH